MNKVGSLFEPAETPSVSWRNPLFRTAFDIGVGALLGAGLASHIFAVAWGPAPDRVADRVFTVIVIGAGVLGFVAYFIALPRFWREARGRITPWIAVGASLWLAANWSLQLVPSGVPHFFDPRTNLAAYTVFAEIALFVVAVLAFIDWRINREERLELEKRNG